MQDVPGASGIERASFVSTVRPTPGQRRAALVVAAVSVAVFLLVAPFATVQLPAVVPFLPVYQSALVIFDLITCVLVFGQYRMLRNPALLLLGAGYAFSALLAIAHALSFPGLFAPGGLLGSGPQTTAWLYFGWHAGFALFILAYAVAGPHARPLPGTHGSAVAAGLVLAGVAAGILVLVTTAGHDALPRIMAGNMDAPAKRMAAMATWVIGVAALVALWRRDSQTVLDLWLMVVLCVWIADTALSAVLNHGRFDVGWYAGRIYGLAANGFVLGVLLMESGSLYARLAESNRLLAEALEEMRRLNGDLQSFAGGLAHDLQQPLVTISGFARLLQRGDARAAQADHLERIIGASESARRMIAALLEFARLGESPLHSEPVDLDAVVAQARASVAPAGQAAEVQWHVAELPMVEGDPALLLLAFVNLLSNAVKYSATRDQPVVRVELAAQADGHCVVHVRDNGVGFDMCQAARLFRPFERLHPVREFEGTGMGLANVRRIVERHGGSVSARSQPGEGATFIVTLPLARIPAGVPAGGLSPA